MNLSEGVTKRDLRRQMRTEAASCPPEEMAEASARICRRLTEQAIWRRAGSVLLYMPILGEPDVRPLIREALKAGKLAALPRFVGPPQHYAGCRIPDADVPLVPGPFGILEPGVEYPAVDVKQLDLLLVPGLAFTVDGCRLGRGKGYYDLLLAGVPGAKCGVAFDWQILSRLPLEPHDVLLDYILTPTRWHQVVGRARS